MKNNKLIKVKLTFLIIASHDKEIIKFGRSHMIAELSGYVLD